jgi:oxygen-independent coproporphyrinogen-3 oxidase
MPPPAIRAIDPETLVRLDASVPRYTSYPTVPAWTRGLPSGALEAALDALAEPASVYVHVPFCREQCWFCGCNMVVAGRQDAGDRYLDALAGQLDRLPLRRARIARLHLGGGTPTWLSIAQLHRLFALIDARFDRDLAEVSVEIDPEVTSLDQLDALTALGLTRISIGVQSFDPRVLHAIHRPQDPERIERLLTRARDRGLRGLNLDLVYGLPHQDLASLSDTLAEVVRLRPDRVALYSFAHVPWAKPHQRRIDTSALPTPLAKAELFLHGFETMVRAGYEPVGMDHFALPDDELAVAARNGRLHRNFMGYTTRRELEIVGLGVSAITELEGLYAQQHTGLAAWYRAMAQRESGIERGCLLTAEDRLRRDLIASLMCNLRIDFDDTEQRYGFDFATRFAPELAAWGELEDQGLLLRRPGCIVLTDLGRFAVRRVAATLDTSLGEVDASRFSRAI